MQRLLVSQVSLLRPNAGFLHGMRCPPNLDPLAKWGDLTQVPGAAAARSWPHGHSPPSSLHGGNALRHAPMEAAAESPSCIW